MEKQIRRIHRLIIFLGEVFLFVFKTSLHRGSPPRQVHLRTLALRLCARRILSRMNIKIHVHGTPLEVPLVVANHLSYLDILAFASQRPLVFVAKSDVANWPFLGFLARLAGSLFIDRHHIRHQIKTHLEMQSLIRRNLTVMLFPEGTSSNGINVLPFRSSVFAPAAQHAWLVQPATIRYTSIDGNPATDLCWWGDREFLPHFFHWLTLKDIHAHIHWLPPIQGTCRKQLAKYTHQVIQRFHQPSTS